MAIDFSLPISEQIEESRSSSNSIRAFSLLRRATGVAISVLLDLGTIAVGCIVSIFFYQAHNPLDGRTAGLFWIDLFLKYGIAFVILARAHQLYTQRDTLLQVAETARILSVSFYSLILLSVGTYLTKSTMPRLLLIYFGAFTAVLLVLQKHTTSRFIRRTALVSDQRRVLICGTSREARRLFSYLLHTPSSGRIPIGFLDETGCDNRRIIYSHDYILREHAPVISEPLSEYLFRSLDVQEIFVTPTISQSRMNEILALAVDAGVSVSLVGACHPYFAEHCTSVQMFDGLMLTTFDTEGEPPLAYLFCKRAIDFLVSCLLLVLTLPVWLAVAVLVKATSKGPVFFRQERIGQSGKPFVMLKFRSMYADTPRYARSPERSDDTRITPAGRFLRRTSLDELPQFLNVLAGDMSLVGPRPEMPYVTEKYTPLERRRLSVPQGLTGFWQLSGDRRFRIHEAIEYDLYYIENRGTFLDLAILLHTLAFAMKGL